MLVRHRKYNAVDFFRPLRDRFPPRRELLWRVLPVSLRGSVRLLADRICAPLDATVPRAPLRMTVVFCKGKPGIPAGFYVEWGRAGSVRILFVVPPPRPPITLVWRFCKECLQCSRASRILKMEVCFPTQDSPWRVLFYWTSGSAGNEGQHPRPVRFFAISEAARIRICDDPRPPAQRPKCPAGRDGYPDIELDNTRKPRRISARRQGDIPPSPQA